MKAEIGADLHALQHGDGIWVYTCDRELKATDLASQFSGTGDKIYLLREEMTELLGFMLRIELNRTGDKE